MIQRYDDDQTKKKIVKNTPFFNQTLVQEVTYDIRSANSTIEYFSPQADNKNGGRVSISLSKLPAYCVLEIFNNNQTFKI